MMRRLAFIGLPLLCLSAGAQAFTSDPGPVQNISVLNHYRHSLEISFDAPANAAEVKSYYVEWTSSATASAGAKMDPYKPGKRTVVQVQPLQTGVEYSIRISPVDTEGNRGSPTLLTRMRPLGTFEAELETLTDHGRAGFLFDAAHDAMMVRPDITKLHNDLTPNLHFGGNMNSDVFDYASIANNHQMHWHWTARQTSESNVTTRLKGNLYLGDDQIHSLNFDTDAGPLGRRSWYVVLTPAKLSRMHLIPKGGEDGDNALNSWPLEQVRVKIDQEHARVTRYRNGVKIQEQDFNWRRAVHFNVRQRLKMDISRRGVTFFADVDYTGDLFPIGTFGTDLSGWTNSNAYLVLGLYPDLENSRVGMNAWGRTVYQDAFGLMHWDKVAFHSGAGRSPAELSYFKDADIAVRARTLVQGTQAFTINVEAERAGILGRELSFMDGSHFPECGKPSEAIIAALAASGTQVRVNGVALPKPTEQELRHQAPGYQFTIPAGVLRAGANTVQITGASIAIPIFHPQIDLMYPADSPAIAAYTRPPMSPVVDNMPANAVLNGWSLPSVDFTVPRMASGSLNLPYKVDATHTIQMAGVVIPVTTMTATMNGTSFWMHQSSGVGSVVHEGNITLDTTQYPDGYHDLRMSAHTKAGTIGFNNGSETGGMNMYEPGRRLLIYNGAPVTTTPLFQNLRVTERTSATGSTLSQTPLASDGEAIVKTGRFYDLQFEVVTAAYLQDVQLLWQKADGSWDAVNRYKGGSVGDMQGHFAMGDVTVTSEGAVNRFTFHWTYQVPAAHTNSLPNTDASGPWIRYKLVANNVSNLVGEIPFRYRLQDDVMALIEQINVNRTLTISQPINGTIRVRNIGTATWPGDGSVYLGTFMEDTPVLLPEEGLPVTSAVPPGGTFTFHLTSTPRAPGEDIEVNLLMKKRTGYDEIYQSSTTVVSVVTGNNASFISQANVPTYMDPNTTETVTIVMQNTGLTTWTRAAGYGLVPVNPNFNLTWNVPFVPLEVTDSIGPGQQKTFTFAVTAPGFPEHYNFQWRMGQMSTFSDVFGQVSTNVRIEVGDINTPPTFIQQVGDQWVKPGETATFWGTVRSYPLTATYQWQRREPPTSLNPSPVPVDIPGATGTSFTTPILSDADDGAGYILVATNAQGTIRSEGHVRVSTEAPTTFGTPATYQVRVVNDVRARGYAFVPRTIHVAVEKTDGTAADELTLEMGLGNNPIPVARFTLDAGGAGMSHGGSGGNTQAIDMQTQVTHQQSINFTAVAVFNDGTTARVHIPDQYTVLTQPPAAPNLNLPDTADGRTRVSMSPAFTDPSIGSLQLTFNAANGGVPPPTGGTTPPGHGHNSLHAMGVSRAARSGAQTLSPSAAMLDFGSLSLLPGYYQALGTVTDWVGNVSAPSEDFVSVIGDSLSGATVAPNPWDTRLHTGNDIRFLNLTDPATVKIFTVAGHWVRTVKASGGMATWDLKNDNGENVASGIYLYLITNDTDDKARGKLVIIR